MTCSRTGTNGTPGNDLSAFERAIEYPISNKELPIFIGFLRRKVRSFVFWVLSWDRGKSKSVSKEIESDRNDSDPDGDNDTDPDCDTE